MTSKRCLAVILIVAAVLVLLFAFASTTILNRVGAAWSHPPENLLTALSPEAKEMVESAYSGLSPERLVDHHTHILGLGTGGTGAWVNPRTRSWLSPVHAVRFQVYADSAGITDLNKGDQQYVNRLIRLIRSMPHPGRYQILAFDYAHAKDGSPIKERSEFFIPNEYVFELTAKYPDCFLPVMSVHPYRKDAISELVKWSARGGRLIKWLPNAMNIDASDPDLDPYYDKVKELDLTILAHVGEEMAVASAEWQKLGNPLKFRRPLDRGVRVIMAHCASLGDNEDLDSSFGEKVSNFELFLRLMDEKRYEGLLFGDISATTQFNRIGAPLQTMLERRDLHERLINGSDYPLPAVNIVIQTSALQGAGFITAEERTSLNEIYGVNPLLFDFVVKRMIRSPNNGDRFSSIVFYSRPQFSGMCRSLLLGSNSKRLSGAFSVPSVGLHASKLPLNRREPAAAAACPTQRLRNPTPYNGC